MTTIFLLCLLEANPMWISQGFEVVNATEYKQSCTVHDTAKEAAIADFEHGGKYLKTKKLYRLDLKAKKMEEITIPRVRLEVDEK